MKINDIMSFNLKETKDPDAAKIIVAYEKRIEILKRARSAAYTEAGQFEYLRNDILTIIEKIKEIAQQHNVKIEEYQINDVKDYISEFAQHIYDLTISFTDEIEDLEFKIEQFDWPEDDQPSDFDFRKLLPPEK